MKFVVVVVVMMMVVMVARTCVASEESWKMEHVEDEKSNVFVVRFGESALRELASFEAAAERVASLVKAKWLGAAMPHAPNHQVFELLLKEEEEASMMMMWRHNNGTAARQLLSKAADAAVELAVKLLKSAAVAATHHVEWVARQTRKHRVRRAVIAPADPLYNAQWHLHDFALSVNAPAGWAQEVTGAGVTVAVVDDGVLMSHPDLKDQVRRELSYDFNYNDDDPTPFSYDAHGTEAAGAAVAASNTHCGVGVAPDAKLAVIRLLAAATYDYQEAAALGFHASAELGAGVDIYSNSWGPTDDGKRLEAPGPLTLDALRKGVEEGRGGRGVLYVWAGGNGRANGDNCNYDGYANLPYTASIGAVTHEGKYAYYSEACSALLGVAPSSGHGSMPRITTTNNGAGSHECAVDKFGGTSASAPIAAGVAALVLQAVPELSWRDFQGLLAVSGQKVDSHDGDWQRNGAGLWFNHNYGFGRLDTAVLLANARQWTPYQNVQVRTVHADDSQLPSGSQQELEVHIDVDAPLQLQHVQMRLVMAAKSRGHVGITLQSPAGTLSRLQDYHASDVKSNFDWTFMSVANWHEDARGTWIVRFSTNNYSPSKFHVSTLDLIVHGTPL